MIDSIMSRVKKEDEWKMNFGELLESFFAIFHLKLSLSCKWISRKHHHLAISPMPKNRDLQLVVRELLLCVPRHSFKPYFSLSCKFKRINKTTYFWIRSKLWEPLAKRQIEEVMSYYWKPLTKRKIEEKKKERKISKL